MTFTTVGYGDIIPATKSQQVWTAFFILIGVTIAANLIGIVTAMVAKIKQRQELERNLEAKAQEEGTHSTFGFWHVMNKIDDEFRAIFDKVTGFVDDNVHKIEGLIASPSKSQKPSFSPLHFNYNGSSPAPDDTPSRKFQAMKEIQLRMKALTKTVQDLRYLAFVNFMVIWAIILFGMLAMVTLENWSVEEAFYWCIVTICTVGYGDVVPDTRSGKIFTIFFIAIGTSYMAKTLSDLVMVGGSIGY